MTYLGELELSQSTWQAYERAIVRLLQLENFTAVRLVGQTSDRGADILAHKNGRRWLVQVKHQRAKVSLSVVDRTVEAMRVYRAQVPVIAASSGFDARVLAARLSLQREGVPLQLWTNSDVARRIQGIPFRPAICPVELRPYQREAIRLLLDRWADPRERRAMVVLATGLGKTTVAAEWIRRLREQSPDLRILAIAHTNAIVLQLERSFWPFLSSSDRTLIWTGTEKPTASALESVPFVFATLDTASAAAEDGSLPAFDLLVVDECHHVGPAMYQRIIDALRAGRPDGTFLLGLTATPWRPDEIELGDYFGPPLLSVDVVEGLRQGFLSEVDYRMFTDNIDWSALARLPEGGLSPRDINRTLFLDEWDDAVVRRLAKTWGEVAKPRCIVFCKTIDHALRMRDRINALGFAVAETIHSGTGRHRMAPHERNLILARFDEGEIGVMCAVDIFNEGIDVPDVNIVVFQRVTHSRRIFIQQLGRGLRLGPGKDRVIVLDFVSDIRRFAAGLDMKDRLRAPGRLQINSKVSFRRADQEDPQAEAFLREWLHDVAAIEAASEDTSVLRYPPPVSGR